MADERRWVNPLYLCVEKPYDDAVAVIPVSKHEALEEAVRAVVDQDCSTSAGRIAFDDALHRLWLMIYVQTEETK